MRTLNLGIALALAASATSCTEAGVADDTCFFAIGRLSAELVDGERCTSVVRLDYATHEPLGVDIVCGPLMPMEEATARVQAQADTGHGVDTGLGTGTEQVADAASGLYVFYDDPSDYGGVAVVSARTGATLFGGSIVWAGTGQITYPSSWLAADSLVPGCDTGTPPSVSEIDLGTEGQVDDDTLREVMDAAWSTALSTAIDGHGDLHGAHVMLYPRTVGLFSPANAEWLVFFESGP